MSSVARFRIAAPAKVNLTLEVTGLLPNGYHELDTIFCWLDVCDQLEWQDAAETQLTIVGMEGLSAGQDNLVMRALALLETEAARPLRLAISLTKNIPAGGGLGGGSSDAAALLYGVNRSHRLGISNERLEELGARLGADVAFCVRGGCARGQGKGERLTPVDGPEGAALVLVCPDFPCPTPEIYRRWDIAQPRQNPGATQEFVKDRSRWRELLCNDLEPAAEDYRPELALIRQRLQEAGCSRAMLSGSGSSVLGFLADDADGEAVVKELGRDGLQVRLARLVTSGRPDTAELERL